MTATQNQVMHATRPHGGYKGTHQHPPSRYTFNKTSECQQQLQEDLEKLLQEEQHDNTGSPSWAIEATKIVNHAGKSQLFNKRLLAASKIERHLESVGYGYDQSRRPSASSHRSRPQSSTSQSSRPASHTHYKPNSTHQYLTDTMLYDGSEEDGDFRLGRPTRTTLLRARQRCGSAPVNSYSIYKEESQKAAKRNSTRTQLSTGLRHKLGSVSDGQSIHSFLTGARYNRAHYFDAKCVTEHGLYMPRSNPHAAFLMRPSSAGSRDDENSPRTPLDDSDDVLCASDGHQNSASKNTKLSQKTKRRGKCERNDRKTSKNMKMDIVGVDYESRTEHQSEFHDNCMSRQPTGKSLATEIVSGGKTVSSNQCNSSMRCNVNEEEETIFNFMDKFQSVRKRQMDNADDLNVVGSNILEPDFDANENVTEESWMKPGIRCAADVKGKTPEIWNENGGTDINSPDVSEEPRNTPINRPKSSKLLSRPKSAALMQRKPCAANTVSISMNEQAISVRKPKIGNASVKSAFHPKVKPSPKYFHGVCIQGQSIYSNGSVVSPTTIQRQQSAEPQSTLRPKSGKVRKTGVTVKDLSLHLQKENIILGNPTTARDNNGVGFEPSRTLEQADWYPWESQFNETSHDHRSDRLDQRSCPSPVETPYDDTSEEDKIPNSEPEDGNMPALKSSLQRVGSAKLKNVHVHFAEDIRENANQNMESENTNGSAVFYVREDSEVSADFDSPGKQSESQKFELTNIDQMKDTISPDRVFSDTLYLELDYPEVVEGDESSSPVSEVGMSPVQNSELETGKEYRMMAPRGTVKSLLNSEEQMELQPFDETVYQENLYRSEEKSEFNGIRENEVEMDTLRNDNDKQM